MKWARSFLRCLAIALGRCFYGSRAEFDRALGGLREQIDQAPWRRP